MLYETLCEKKETGSPCCRVNLEVKRRSRTDVGEELING